VDSASYVDNDGASRNCSSYGVTDWAGMRIDSSGIQVDTTMQLRGKEHSREEQRQHVDAI
jgi:hypothetical protein